MRLKQKSSKLKQKNLKHKQKLYKMLFWNKIEIKKIVIIRNMEKKSKLFS